MLGHRWVVGGGWSGVGGRGVGGRGGCALTQTPNPNQVDFCPRFQHYGKCEYGKECRFAHDESERRPRVLPIRYKTAICKHFSAYSSCPYGEKCHFSHVQK